MAFGLSLNVQGYTLNFLLNRNGEIPIFLFWRKMKRCVQICRNWTCLEKLDDLNICFTKWMVKVLCNFTAEQIWICDSWLIITLDMMSTPLDCGEYVVIFGTIKRCLRQLEFTSHIFTTIVVPDPFYGLQIFSDRGPNLWIEKSLKFPLLPTSV